MSAHVKQHNCERCGQTDASLFHTGRKSECRSCHNSRISSNYYDNEYLKEALHSCKARAKKKGWEYELSYEQLSEVWDEQGGMCFYYHIPMLKRAGSLDTVSIDRIDCNRGYTIDNIVLCTKHANMGRQASDIHEYITFIRENLS